MIKSLLIIAPEGHPETRALKIELEKKIFRFQIYPANGAIISRPLIMFLKDGTIMDIIQGALTGDEIERKLKEIK